MESAPPSVKSEILNITPTAMKLVSKKLYDGDIVPKYLSQSQQEVFLNNNEPIFNIHTPLNSSKNLIKYEVSKDFLSHNKVEFVKGEALAKGTWGTIYEGLSKNTGAIVAIKHLNIRFQSKQKKLIIEELKKISQIEHQNLLKYIGVQCNDTSSNGI